MATPRTTRTIALLAILAVFAGAGWYFYTRADRADRQPEYTTTTVVRGDITQLVTATGQIDAVLSVDVGSQVSGQIIKLYADFNTRVRAGQKLAELDPSSFEQSVRQAEANLASAQASFTLAELSARRTQELFAKGLMTQQDNDQAQAQLEQARAQLLITKATLENARVNLARCTIYSPIDGMVIAKLTEVGKTVAAGLNVPVLFTIDNDLTKMQITAAVAEADIGAVSEGQSATFTVDAFPNRNFQGVITQVRNAPKNTSNVVTYETIISVDNKELKLRPGMTANVSIIVARRASALRAANATLRVRMPEGLAVAAPDKSGATTAAQHPAPATREGGGRGGMFANATPEQREQMRAIMAEVGLTSFRDATPEQREQLRKLMLERGLSPPEPRPAHDGEPVAVTRTVYRLPRGDKTAAPQAVSVKVGITDGLASEFIEGVSEGDVLITSVNLPGAKPAAPNANPFGGQPRRF